MTHIWSGVKSTRNPDALATLAAEARRDLARLNYPGPDWVPPRPSPDGAPMLDVLVIGGGMCGQTVGFALMRDGIRHFRIIDRSARGEEGPWATYARMEILRSPKHLTGPDLGVPSLTFRAWYEAQHGVVAWQKLHKAGRIDWRDYLLFVRDTAGIPVENGIEATAIVPNADGVTVEVRHGNGRTEPLHARKVVLAGGRDGAGAPRLPSFPGLAQADAAAARPPHVYHSSDAIDFRALKGKRVAILGAGASAFDCAACALEAGAREAVMFVRRPHLPQVNKSKWTSFTGCLKGFAGLDDATRWRFYTYIFAEQVPPPYESVLRCEAHGGFSIRFGESWRDVRPANDGVIIVTANGTESCDAAILGTGFDIDLTLRPELAAFRDNILLWGDRVGPAEAARDPECARFPYLGQGFEFMERQPGATPGLHHIHAFNWGVTLSHGALAGDIPGLRIGVDRLSQALCATLLREDIDPYWQALHDLEDPELKPTRRYVPPEARS